MHATEATEAYIGPIDDELFVAIPVDRAPLLRLRLRPAAAACASARIVPDTHAFATKDEVAAYLEAYAAEFDLPAAA